ncbi:MAG TPA: signal peptidase I [Candidatus Saccharimonadales bacterium]|jgi:signal peptidase I|nr:signal peptidase I [Candidatus Saccharimonadales bacterium]
MNKSRKTLIYSLSIVAVIVVGVLIFGFTQVKVYPVNGKSMEPTLTSGQKVIAVKGTSNIYRGDIIVFKEKNVEYISRVIGLPGDQVVVKDGSVAIYNQANRKGFNPDEDHSYLIKNEKTVGNIDLKLASNQYFVLGDNRSDSLDSRDFGPITKSSIIATDAHVES